MECLRYNAALKHAQPLIVKSNVAPNVVKITYEDVEFFVQLLDLSTHRFPDWPSFLKPTIDLLFQRLEALIKGRDALRHRHLPGADFSNLAAKCTNVIPNCPNAAPKGTKFSKYALLERTRFR